MAKPLLKQCCCCCGDLRIGTMVLFALFIIFNIYLFITSCVQLSNFTPADEHNSHITTADHNDDDPSKQINKYMNSKESLISQLVWSIINSLIISLGLYGVYQKKHGFILPWIILEGASFVLAVISVVVIAIILSFAVPAGFIFLFIFIAAIPLAIFGYMWCVVYSYYAVLQEENSRGLYDKQPYRR